MFKRSTRLLASAAASAGLAFAGLAITAPAAEAATAPATASYSCTNPSGIPSSTFIVPATFSLETLDDVLLANVPVPAGTPFVGQLDFSAAGLIPSLLAVVQGALNTVVGQIPTVGPQVTPQLNLLFTQLQNGSATISGQLGSFVPTGGSVPIPIPLELSFGTLVPILAPLGIRCTLIQSTVQQPNGGTGIPVIAQKFGSKIKAKAINKRGQKAVVKIKVKTSAGQKAVGEVKAKARGVKAKTKALKNGKVKIVLKGLKSGAQKIKVRFLGNGFTDAAKKKVRVKIVR